MEKNYWENFYKSKEIVSEPSLFAQTVYKKYINPGSSLIELGCGNGRDSLFFAVNDVKVTAVDQCEKETSELSNTNKLENLTFLCADFTDLGDIGTFDNVYSRFTLHSITEEGENKTIDWSYNHLKTGGHMLIEARSLKNELYKLGNPVDNETNSYVYNNHYRRFIDIDVLKEKLINKGFLIINAEEKTGFSPFEGVDQTFMRIISVKK